MSSDMIEIIIRKSVMIKSQTFVFNGISDNYKFKDYTEIISIKMELKELWIKINLEELSIRF